MKYIREGGRCQWVWDRLSVILVGRGSGRKTRKKGGEVKAGNENLCRFVAFFELKVAGERCIF